jgi:hypothetical protein
MRWRIEGIARAAVLLACAGCAGAAAAQTNAVPNRVENLRLALNHYTNGQVKTELRAAWALVPPGQPVEAREVRVECFNSQGGLEMVIVAPSLTYDRYAGLAQTDDIVRATVKGMSVSGRGLRWSSKEENVRLLGSVRVMLTRQIGLGLGRRR